MKIIWHLLGFIVWVVLATLYIAGVFNPNGWFIATLFILEAIGSLGLLLVAIGEQYE